MPLEQPQSIRTIFFDAGFTLLYPHPSTPEICQRICQQLDLHIHLDALQERMVEADDFFFRQSRQERHLWASEEAINAFWLDYYMNFLRPFVEEHDEPRLYQLARRITQEFEQHTSWQIFPDVLPTLEVLKARKYTLGIISDWGISLGRILHEHHLNRYFDHMLVSALTRHAKPSPALYERAFLHSRRSRCTLGWHHTYPVRSPPAPAREQRRLYLDPLTHRSPGTAGDILIYVGT
ncbi:MAG: hypothetical protein E6I93_15725 [Chloroflexi bacterium]|nr:MAG: hypothetical protein E6I93_15725 [Chloroflexota bacterium]